MQNSRASIGYHETARAVEYLGTVREEVSPTLLQDVRCVEKDPVWMNYTQFGLKSKFKRTHILQRILYQTCYTVYPSAASSH